MAHRLSRNVQGRFYVDSNCINCSLCPGIAPDNFMTDHHKGCEYVCKQPENEQELALVEESMILCPCNAIHDNGQELK